MLLKSQEIIFISRLNAKIIIQLVKVQKISSMFTITQGDFELLITT